MYQDKTCNELESGNCYDDNFRHVCCEMCDNARSDTYGKWVCLMATQRSVMLEECSSIFT